MKTGPLIGVIGTGEDDARLCAHAEEVGRLIAMRGCILVNGGLGGVMEASSRGAKAAGGLTVGILPGNRPEDANPYVDVPIATGLGEMRNLLIVRACRALIAIGGGYGTLSEIALALKTGRPVVGLDTWDVAPDMERASNPAGAVKKALAAAGML